MAMSKALLGLAIADLIVSSEASAEDKAVITALWTDIAGAIIDHITSLAVVTTPLTTVIPIGGVISTCPPPSGVGTSTAPATGTGTGTGSIA